MAVDEFEDPAQDDDYRKKVIGTLDPDSGIAGPAMTTNTAMPSAPAQTGGYDLEKVRKGWAYGGDGFASKVGMSDLQKFLADNQSFTQGVTLKGEKLYDPSGKFMFDAIGNYKSGDPNQMTRIALDGVGHPTAPKISGPKTIAPPISGPKTIGPQLDGPVTSASTLAKPKTVPKVSGPKTIPPVTVGPPKVSGPQTLGGPTNLPPGGGGTVGGPTNLPPGVGGPQNPGGPTNLPPGTPPPIAPPAPPAQPPGLPPPPGAPPADPPPYGDPGHFGRGTPDGMGTGTKPQDVPPAANDFLTKVRETMMGRLEQMQKDPSIKDPALAAQSGAFRQARERGATQQRQAAAERAAANGTLQGGQSSGAFDTTIGGIQEGAGQDIASNDSQLVGQEVQARRAEVQNLLSMAMQSGDNESARALQEKLGLLDAQLRREGLSENARQYDSSFGENQRQFGMNFAEDQRQFGLDDKYRYAGLGEDRRQFDAGLGENKRQFNATDKYRYKTLAEQQREWNDQHGRNLGRDFEEDYWRRVVLGLG